MAIYIQGLSNTDQTIDLSSDVFVTADAVLDATMFLSGGSNDVNVAGYVYNISEGDDSPHFSGDDIIVTGSGAVIFLGLKGGDNSVTNSGLIGGDIGGIEIEAGAISQSLTANYIVNSGMITNRNFLSLPAIRVSAPSADTIIINNGVISSLYNYAISLGGAGGSIVNSGAISGGIKLGNGGSEVDNAGGSVSGGVLGGSAADTVLNSGTITGSVSLGGGSDTLDNTATIFGAVDLGAGGGKFTNGGTVKGSVTLGGASDFGFLDSRTGAIYGSITGGGAGNTIFASLVGNSITGGAGGDTVRGGIGDDTIATLGNFDFLFGRGGDDKLDGGAGGDTMIGGSGDDEYIVDGVGDLVNEVRQDGSGYDLVRVKAGINFDLTNRAQVRGQIEDLYMDGATGLEAIDGSGNGLDNIITGNGGANTLDGRDGNDELLGAAGNDTLRGGAGADLLNGGAGGSDTADYSVGATAGITVALDLSLVGTGDALGDTFFGIERLRGTKFDDTLRGNNLANVIYGQGGADTISGQDGDDRLVGGIGIDTLTGGNGNDTFEFNSQAEIGDIITDFIGYNDLLSINEVIVVKGSAFGGIVNFEENVIDPLIFETRADNVAQDANDGFIFRTTDRTLWFDIDGNGAAAAVMMADFQAGADVGYNDITVV